MRIVGVASQLGDPENIRFRRLEHGSISGVASELEVAARPEAVGVDILLPEGPCLLFPTETFSVKPLLEELLSRAAHTRPSDGRCPIRRHRFCDLKRHEPILNTLVSSQCCGFLFCTNDAKIFRLWMECSSVLRQMSCVHVFAAHHCHLLTCSVINVDRQQALPNVSVLELHTFPFLTWSH